MLKLTYTDAGLHMEKATDAVESLVTQRVILALRLGQTLHIEPSRASFLLPGDAPGLNQLQLSMRLERNRAISISAVDAQFVEVSLRGNWIADSLDAHEGMFITALGDRAEFLVHRLWQNSQGQVSALIQQL
jgi:hypothetical protein